MTRAYVCHLLLMSLYITVLHTIPAPANLTIVSQNFRHILQWSPGIASPPRTVFNVKQSCEGSKKPGKSAVRVNVTRTTVDVSKALRNIWTYCTFSVWASLGNARSAEVNTSITPYEDTSIGPPDVSLSGCGNCLKISISPPPDTPLTPQTGRFYNSVEYKISWRKAGQTEAEHISTLKNQTVLQNLQPGQQYCVKVLPQINSNPNTQESEWKCEYTSRVEPRGGKMTALTAAAPDVARTPIPVPCGPYPHPSPSQFIPVPRGPDPHPSSSQSIQSHVAQTPIPVHPSPSQSHVARTSIPVHPSPSQSHVARTHIPVHPSPSQSHVAQTPIPVHPSPSQSHMARTPNPVPHGPDPHPSPEAQGCLCQ
ncbi:interferon alpha/beta receptor 2-like [Pimephales promelas]|uniref:interferon alpha/beta receptor 2-like n=1 Tax=Pimephales promelas TaxID=90988 RepID=UPI001955F44B|nr:interferon alpha/beta receptor 2-like [Pimephales promelas]KAG1929087.1 interleukin-10 receptor subunit beta [Pimephales promelas]